MKKLLVGLIFTSFFIFSYSATQDYFSLGKSSQEKELWFDAIEYYQQAILENPSHSKALQGLAESYYALDDYKQALKMVERAEMFRTNSSEIINLKGFIYIGMRNLEEAKKNFEKVLKSWPNDVQARFGLAEIEVSLGRISSAQDLYIEALHRKPENRKALLSLATIHFENKNFDLAQQYIQKALEFHGDNAQTFYFSAYFDFLRGKYGDAERFVRKSLVLDQNAYESMQLLSTILLKTNRFSELLEICDQRIKINRNDSDAWYLKSIALEKQGKYLESIKNSKIGLSLSSNDEVFRAFADQLVHSSLDLEDALRKDFSLYHHKKAVEYEKNNLITPAISEYKQTLKLDPYNTEARLSYAQLLLQKGLSNTYLEQLQFIKDLGTSSIYIDDSIESFSKLLKNSLQAKWGIKSLFIDKAHTKLGLYYELNQKNIIHPDAEKFTTVHLADFISLQNQLLDVKADSKAIVSYSDAFQRARKNNQHYFAIVNFNESLEDLEISIDIYVGSTGSKVNSISVFRTGNNKYFNVLERASLEISQLIPVYGTILLRSQNNAIIDLGKTNSVLIGSVFDIISAEIFKIDTEGKGLAYNKDSVLGSFTVTQVDDDIAEGILKRNGFYDRISVGSYVVAIPLEENKIKETPIDETIKHSTSQYRDNNLLNLLRFIR